MPERPRHARSLDEALANCARHGRGAVSETGAALAAAVDACSFVVFGCAADQSALEPFWLLVVEFIVVLGAPVADRDATLSEFGEALDREIARWERRGREDPDARAVARAFAELRALVHEFGSPRGGTRRHPGARDTGHTAGARTGARSRRPRERHAQR